jgi:ribosomal protein L23
VRIGRLGWLVAVAAALALTAVAPSIARVQKRHVVVVKGRGFKLLAWDAAGRDKSLCVLLKAGKPNSSECAQKLNPQGFQVISFQDSKRTFAMVGGATKKSIKKVVVSFFDGKQVTVKTKTARAYRGRRKGKVRFFAIKHRGSAPFRAVVAKP